MWYMAKVSVGGEVAAPCAAWKKMHANTIPVETLPAFKQVFEKLYTPTWEHLSGLLKAHK